MLALTKFCGNRYLFCKIVKFQKFSVSRPSQSSVYSDVAQMVQCFFFRFRVDPLS